MKRLIIAILILLYSTTANAVNALILDCTEMGKPGETWILLVRDSLHMALPLEELPNEPVAKHIYLEILETKHQEGVDPKCTI